MTRAQRGILILICALVLPATSIDPVAWFNVSSRCAGYFDAISGYLRPMDEETAKHAKGLGVQYTEIANLLDYLNNETRDKSEDISAAKLDELYNYAYSDMMSVLEASKGSEVQSLLLDDRKAGQGVRSRAQQNLAVCFKMLREVERKQ